jgi:hypothetical protein
MEELSAAEQTVRSVLEYHDLELWKPENRLKMFSVPQAAKLSTVPEHVLRRAIDRGALRTIEYPNVKTMQVPYSFLVLWMAQYVNRSLGRSDQEAGWVEQ